MADRELHNYLCMKVLGKGFNEVNAFLDAPVRVKGPSHRNVFHDNETMIKISLFNLDIGMAAMLHKILDEDKDLEAVLRSMIDKGV